MVCLCCSVFYMSPRHLTVVHLFLLGYLFLNHFLTLLLFIKILIIRVILLGQDGRYSPNAGWDAFCLLLICSLWSFRHPPAGVSSSKDLKVLQTPEQLLASPDEDVRLTCAHKDLNFNTILWYQRRKGDAALELIGFMYYQSLTIEPPFVGQFNISGNGESTAVLHIVRARHSEHSAQYFSAARQHSDKSSWSVWQKVILHMLTDSSCHVMRSETAETQQQRLTTCL